MTQLHAASTAGKRKQLAHVWQVLHRWLTGLQCICFLCYAVALRGATNQFSGVQTCVQLKFRV
jgi:hypothetical protein